MRFLVLEKIRVDRHEIKFLSRPGVMEGAFFDILEKTRLKFDL